MNQLCLCLPGFRKGLPGPYPELELVEHVSGDAGAGDARQDQCGDEHPKRHHVLGWTLSSRQLTLQRHQEEQHKRRTREVADDGSTNAGAFDDVQRHCRVSWFSESCSSLKAETWKEKPWNLWKVAERRRGRKTEQILWQFARE